MLTRSAAHKAAVLVADLAIAAAAPYLALLVIHDLTLQAIEFGHYLLVTAYAAITLTVASVVFVVAGLHRRVLTLTSFHDFGRVVQAAVMTVLLSAAAAFVLTRLDGISRSLVLLQLVFTVLGLGGLRALARIFAWRTGGMRGGDRQDASAAAPRAISHVVLVGVNTIADFYIRVLREFGGGRVSVVGVLTDDPRLAARVAYGVPILGPPASVRRILEQLGVHGIAVDAIIVATPPDEITPATRAALAELALTASVRVEMLAERLALSGFAGGNEVFSPALIPLPVRQPHTAVNRYVNGICKRTVDVAVAAVLLLAGGLALVSTAALAAIDVGLPILFWQQRPGRHGWPFRIYKFRTMGAAYAVDGSRIDDAERSSLIGRLLRRTRADELPQLWNILTGEMSFVGPRPLLSIDQPSETDERLSVRPGVTGWAQVNGGRLLSIPEKTALDLWYIRNATFSLDLRIIARTLMVAVFGEARDEAVIAAAARAAGIALPRQPSLSPVSGPLAAGPAR